MPRLTLSEIHIYPIKSLGGIRLEKAVVQGKGLQFDRRWMLVDKAGVFLTQRTHPEMALFKPEIQGELISITFRKGQKTDPSISFNPRTPPSGKWMAAKIWDDEVSVIEVDAGISQWFSHHLGINCKLVYFPEEKPRPVDAQYKVNNEQVSLADAYPFLIIGQSSLDGLNAMLPEPLPMNRFRPNFVFVGGDPYEEDTWRNLSIGKIRFVAVKKSDRCAITTVNQDTAEKGSEPLRTLSGYRKVNNKIFFGQNLVALNEGEVAVGDSVIPE
jgi:uncharacterized protein YcbX